MEAFLGCVLGFYISDNNELIVDDKLRHLVTNIFLSRLNGKQKLAALVADDCIKHCKDTKDDNQGKAAVKITICLKERFDNYINE